MSIEDRSIEDLQRLREARETERVEKKTRAGLDANCVESLDGVMVRAIIPRKKCWKCRRMRWDDGAGCGYCGAESLYEDIVEEDTLP